MDYGLMQEDEIKAIQNEWRDAPVKYWIQFYFCFICEWWHNEAAACQKECLRLMKERERANEPIV